MQCDRKYDLSSNMTVSFLQPSEQAKLINNYIERVLPPGKQLHLEVLGCYGWKFGLLIRRLYNLGIDRCELPDGIKVAGWRIVSSQ